MCTQFGPVVDLSASGLKALCRGWRSPRVGEVVDLEITHPAGQFTIKGCIARIRRLGLRRYEAAFTFADVTDEQREAILKATRATLRKLSLEHDRQRV